MGGLHTARMMQALIVVVIFDQVTAAGNDVALPIAIIAHSSADKGFRTLPITVFLNRTAITAAGIAGVVMAGPAAVVTGIAATMAVIVVAAAMTVTVAAIVMTAAMAVMAPAAVMASIAVMAVADIDRITGAGTT